MQNSKQLERIYPPCSISYHFFTCYFLKTHPHTMEYENQNHTGTLMHEWVKELVLGRRDTDTKSPTSSLCSVGNENRFQFVVPSRITNYLPDLYQVLMSSYRMKYCSFQMSSASVGKCELKCMLNLGKCLSNDLLFGIHTLDTTKLILTRESNQICFWESIL